MDHAEFVYRLKGTQTWNLIDAALTPTEDGRTWTLGSWDLQTLQHGAWYEVAVHRRGQRRQRRPEPRHHRGLRRLRGPPPAMSSRRCQDAPWCNGIMDLVVHGRPRCEPAARRRLRRGLAGGSRATEVDVIPENWLDWQADGWSVYGVASDRRAVRRHDEPVLQHARSERGRRRQDNGDVPVFPTGPLRSARGRGGRRGQHHRPRRHQGRGRPGSARTTSRSPTSS